jgi:hypothetical protein
LLLDRDPAVSAGSDGASNGDAASSRRLLRVGEPPRSVSSATFLNNVVNFSYRRLV